MNKEEMRTPFQIYSGRSLTVRFDEGLLLFFGLRGRCVVTVGEEQYPLEKAGLLLINPLTIYRLHCPLDASVLVLRVEKEVLEREKWQGDCICYRESSREESGADRKVRGLLAQLFQYYFEHPETALVTRSRYLSELLHNLKTRFPGGALKQPVRESTMLRLGSILDRIADRWNEELSLNAIAEEEYLSVSYLSRFFQKN
ncbi:MAG: hypothetical protein Q4B09_11830, partial [Lachnospiraceae bacterium]|nr:hypothetical protein [Lachnospiraceae bacterium]